MDFIRYSPGKQLILKVRHSPPSYLGHISIKIMTQVFPVLPHPSFPPHSSLPIRWMSPEVLPLDPPGPRLVPRGPLEGEVWVGLGSHLFPHSVPLFCLQGSGHLAFALTSATDQKQDAYSGTPEVKVPRAGVGGVLCSGLDWRRDSRKRAHPD